MPIFVDREQSSKMERKGTLVHLVEPIEES